jgi:ribosomal protein S8
MEKLQKAINQSKNAKEVIERLREYSDDNFKFYLGSNNLPSVAMSTNLSNGIKSALKAEVKRLELENNPLFDKIAALELLL